jgi:hypothetical protein
MVELVVVGAVISNTCVLGAGERGLRAADDSVRASLAAIELASRLPSLIDAPAVTAGAYLDAVRDLDSPAFTVSDLEQAPEPACWAPSGRDRQARAIPAQPCVTGSDSVDVEADSGGRIVAMAYRPELRPTISLAASDLRVSVASALLMHTSPAAHAYVYLRRFASAFRARRFALPSLGTSRVQWFSYGRAPEPPGNVQVSATAPMEVCQG